MAGRDNPVLYATHKLSGEWSAPNFAPNLTVEMVDALTDKFGKLDTSVRMRLLLSTLFLRPAQLDTARPQLQRLVETAASSGDEDEWVRVVARAVGRLNGLIDVDALQAETRDVRQGLQALARLMEQGGNAAADFSPMETPYLNHRLVPASALAAGAAGAKERPFVLREGAEEEATAQLLRGAGTAPDLARPVAGGADSAAATAAKEARARRGQAVDAADIGFRKVLRNPSRAPMGLASSHPGGAAGCTAGGAQRAAADKKPKVKQLDVSEAIQLNREASARKQQAKDTLASERRAAAEGGDAAAEGGDAAPAAGAAAAVEAEAVGGGASRGAEGADETPFRVAVPGGEEGGGPAAAAGVSGGDRVAGGGAAQGGSQGASEDVDTAGGMEEGRAAPSDGDAGWAGAHASGQGELRPAPPPTGGRASPAPDASLGVEGLVERVAGEAPPEKRAKVDGA